MKIKTNKIHPKHLIQHETKKPIFVKFIILLFVLLAYTGYLSYEYGFATGGFLAVITWSFFVLCTPIADAGMLLDFPIRILFRLRMFMTELFVWFVAISVNIYAFFINPEIYKKSALGHIFYEILANPIPYWSIFILSFAGTFLSVHFADELMDYIKYSELKKNIKHRLIFEGIIMISIFLLIFFIYSIIINKFGFNFNNLK